jgi:DNA-binding SARP family transcriptional activator
VAVLHLLGRLGLETAVGTPPVRLQPRRLALLALIATAEYGARRDVLMGRLWPESSQAAARNALKQAIFGIRAALPEGALQGRDTLWLDTTLVQVDRTLFLEAVEREDWQEAVRVYGGRFLDGVHVKGAYDFEVWASGEADRLAGHHAHCLEALAREAEERGAMSEAIRWWHARVHASPLASAPVLQLMQALLANGDAPAALAVARRHEQVLARELDAPPDGGVVELVQRIRGGRQLSRDVQQTD